MLILSELFGIRQSMVKEKGQRKQSNDVAIHLRWVYTESASSSPSPRVLSAAAELVGQTPPGMN